METLGGGNSTRLIDDLVKNGPLYNVWQAVWIAENITKKDNAARKDYLLDQTGIRFRPYENYEYPPCDIKAIRNDDGVITFILTFLGLYGINSPLPRCYHEQVTFQQRILGSENVPLQNFLDIFNNRFYWLYYNSWKKYRFYLFLNGTGNKVFERINSFMGVSLLSKNKKSYLSGFALLKFAGIFSQRVRNKAGLKILLGYFFSNINIVIREFVPKWIELSDIPSLGSDDFMLGTNSFIGYSTADYSSKILLEIGPINFDDYLNFLPGTENSNKIVELLNLYLNDGVEYDFNFKIYSETIKSVSWDDERLKLGSTLWLGKPEDQHVEVYLNYDEIIKHMD